MIDFLPVYHFNAKLVVTPYLSMISSETKPGRTGLLTILSQLYKPLGDSKIVKNST